MEKVRAELDAWRRTLTPWLGLGVVVYEGLVDHFHNPYVLAIAAGMLGIERVRNAARHSSGKG